MNRARFWLMMWVLMNIASNGESNIDMEVNWAIASWICFAFSFFSSGKKITPTTPTGKE